MNNSHSPHGIVELVQHALIELNLNRNKGLPEIREFGETCLPLIGALAVHAQRGRNDRGNTMLFLHSQAICSNLEALSRIESVQDAENRLRTVDEQLRLAGTDLAN